MKTLLVRAAVLALAGLVVGFSPHPIAFEDAVNILTALAAGLALPDLVRKGGKDA